MKHALSALADIGAVLRGASRVLIASDFDGTLCPIAPSPSEARLTAEMLGVLKALAGSPAIQLAVISGRALSDVRRQVPLDLIFAGNHGLEISGKGLDFEHARARRLRPAMSLACEALAEAVRPWPAAWMEDKDLSATLHFRQVPVDDHSALALAARARAERFGRGLAVRPGKLALEVRPNVSWHKGSALRYILEEAGPFDACVCLGDDRTDEAMFRANPAHLNVRIGRSPASAARYFLRGPEESGLLLSRIAKMLSSGATVEEIACMTASRPATMEFPGEMESDT